VGNDGPRKSKKKRSNLFSLKEKSLYSTERDLKQDSMEMEHRIRWNVQIAKI
jgi:hypothetical protein